jgi:hypothetical protein
LDECSGFAVPNYAQGELIMDRASMAPVITQLCDRQLQQFQIVQELLLQIAAVVEVMKDRGDKHFQSDFQKKILHLRQGELGQKIVQDIDGFQRTLQALKSQLS